MEMETEAQTQTPTPTEKGEGRFTLVTRNLQEVLGKDRLRELLSDPRSEPVVYWGTAPTGRIHIAYIGCLLKVADLVEAGCRVKILVADLHAYLDNMKSTLPELEARTTYYIEMIRRILLRLNVDVGRVEFVKGTSFQLSPEYTMDVYRANSLTTYHEARHAGAEVVRQTDNPTMNALLYPTLQALDMEYLKADAFLGGVDQRKINVLGLELLPKLGYRKGVYLMAGMVPGLQTAKGGSGSGAGPAPASAKMSSSDKGSKIDILDSKDVIRKNINQSYCLVGDAVDNTPLMVAEKLVFPVLAHLGLSFVINRPAKFGGPITYHVTDFERLRDDFGAKRLHPADFKLGLSDAIDTIVAPIRTAFEDEDLRKLLGVAYPDP